MIDGLPKPDWQTDDGAVRLYRGDCLELLPKLPSGCVDAVVTDPPYGIGFEYIGYDDTTENLEKIIAGFLPHARRIAKRVVFTPGNTNIAKYPPADWYCAWTWNTTTARGRVGWSQWQPILFYGEDVSRGTRNHDGMLKSDRIDFTGGRAKIDGAAGKGHPCAKPVAFMDRMIRRWSHAGEKILDPFMGSGTTGVACVQTGRRFIGIEKEPKYFDIAVGRIENALREQRERLPLEDAT